MATVELRFSALPAHVRTARLVAAAVARRSGVDEAVLDELRLAVGEACSRAVHLHRLHCPDIPVMVMLVDDEGAFSVTVADEAPQDRAEDASPLAELASVAEVSESVDLELEELVPEVGLAVISGLVEDVEVEPRGQGGLAVRMRWPIPA